MSRTPLSSLNLLGKRFLYLTFLFVLIGLGSTATTFDTKVSGQSATQSCPTMPTADRADYLRTAHQAEWSVNYRNQS